MNPSLSESEKEKRGRNEVKIENAIDEVAIEDGFDRFGVDFNGVTKSENAVVAHQWRGCNTNQPDDLRNHCIDWKTVVESIQNKIQERKGLTSFQITHLDKSTMRWIGTLLNILDQGIEQLVLRFQSRSGDSKERTHYLRLIFVDRSTQQCIITNNLKSFEFHISVTCFEKCI